MFFSKKKHNNLRERINKFKRKYYHIKKKKKMFNGENNKSNIIIAIRLRPLLPDEKKISDIKTISTYENSTLRLLMPVNFNPYEKTNYINFENVKIKQ